MDIVTGHVGSAHVTSWQDRDLNQGIFGPGTYILNVGSKMAATIISNNEIHIADGTLVMQGCQGAIQKGTYDTISIDNGSSGMKRNDLICAEYTKVGGVESLGWTVIKGTPAASNPSDPSYTSGDIQNGDTPVQVPIYRAVLNGLTLESVNLLVPLRDNFEDIDSYLNDVGSIIDNAGTASLPTSTWVDMVSITLAKGIYIVFGSVDIRGSVTGTRQAQFKDMDTVVPLDSYNQVNATSSYTIVHVGGVVKLNSSKTITIQGWQSSGSTLSGDASITAIRIK